MNWTWNLILSGIVLILMAWCYLNTNFININTERIEKLEEYLPVVNQVDTVYIINFTPESKKK